MVVTELAPGLWRWTAPHPGLASGRGLAAGGRLRLRGAARGVVLSTRSFRQGEADRFWAALDRDVERLGLPVRVLETVRWHERSVDGSPRIDGAVWRGRRRRAGVAPIRRRGAEMLARPHVPRPGDVLPDGPSALPAVVAAEGPHARRGPLASRPRPSYRSTVLLRRAGAKARSALTAALPVDRAAGRELAARRCALEPTRIEPT